MQKSKKAPLGTVLLMCPKKPKSPVILDFLLYQLLSTYLVEARGFAPLYRRAATKAYTRISFILSFAIRDS